MKAPCKQCKGSGTMEVKELSIEDKARILDMKKEYNDLMQNPPQVEVKIPRVGVHFKANLCWEEGDFPTVGEVFGPIKSRKLDATSQLLLDLINKLSYGIDEYETREMYWDILIDSIKGSKEWKEFSRRIKDLCKEADKLSKKYDNSNFNWDRDVACDYYYG